MAVMARGGPQIYFVKTNPPSRRGLFSRGVCYAAWNGVNLSDALSAVANGASYWNERAPLLAGRVGVGIFLSAAATGVCNTMLYDISDSVDNRLTPSIRCGRTGCRSSDQHNLALKHFADPLALVLESNDCNLLLRDASPVARVAQAAHPAALTTCGPVLMSCAVIGASVNIKGNALEAFGDNQFGKIASGRLLQDTIASVCHQVIGPATRAQRGLVPSFGAVQAVG
ncbi:hypothetical protein KCP77_23335 [Salmonella enterica subsp. enterica]|nr:hypothetical protein KCP77_23335 [Salmonella enterica subsp. enterica]